MIRKAKLFGGPGHGIYADTDDDTLMIEAYTGRWGWGQEGMEAISELHRYRLHHIKAGREIIPIFVHSDLSMETLIEDVLSYF